MKKNKKRNITFGNCEKYANERYNQKITTYPQSERTGGGVDESRHGGYTIILDGKMDGPTATGCRHDKTGRQAVSQKLRRLFAHLYLAYR